MYNTQSIRSFASLLAKVFRFKQPKKVKRYPSMVVSSPEAIAKHNRQVEAGLITKVGNRRANRAD